MFYHIKGENTYRLVVPIVEVCGYIFCICAVAGCKYGDMSFFGLWFHAVKV